MWSGNRRVKPRARVAWIGPLLVVVVPKKFRLIAWGWGMKKPQKGAVVPKTVDEYLAGVPEPARSTLKKVRAVIQAVLPEEAIEVISYRIPVVKYKGMLVGYAAFAGHCSLFGMSGTLLGLLNEDLKKYSTSKGTIRFPVDKPLPATLIRKLVKSAIAQNEARQKR